MFALDKTILRLVFPAIQRVAAVVERFAWPIRRSLVALLLAAFAGTSAAQSYTYAGKFGSSGNSNGQFSTPSGLAIDPASRNIVVGDSGNNRVQIFDAAGSYLGHFGSTGCGNGQFRGVAGVAIDVLSHSIFVTGFNCGRVQVFNSNGTYTGQFGTLGSGNGQFQSPIGIAIDPVSHNVVVADRATHHVQMFSPAGVFISQVGTLGAGSQSGSGNGQFNQPNGVAIDPVTRNIVVTDSGNYRVQIFNSSGIYLSQFGTSGSGNGQFGFPYNVAIDPVNSNIIVTDNGSNRVHVFTSTGVFINRFGSVGSDNGQFQSPSSIAIDPTTRSALIVDTQNSRVQIFGAPAVASVVEFYNQPLDNYFITANASEQAAIDGGSAGPGWSRTGMSFKSDGRTQVCRFYGSISPGPNSHFYTIDAAECQALKDQQFGVGDPRRLMVKSWNFESLDFASTPATSQSCPPGTIPVYRAYNDGFARAVDSNHRITTSTAALQEVVSRGWKNEGVVMCAPL